MAVAKGKGLRQINGGFPASNFDGIGTHPNALRYAGARKGDVTAALADVLVKGDFQAIRTNGNIVSSIGWRKTSHYGRRIVDGRRHRKVPATGSKAAKVIAGCVLECPCRYCY
jgi:hypothetical protein